MVRVVRDVVQSLVKSSKLEKYVLIHLKKAHSKKKLQFVVMTFPKIIHWLSEEGLTIL